MLRREEISSRIETLRFPLIVGVVFIHNFHTTVAVVNGSFGVTSCGTWVDFIRFFISQGIARMAVPLFFLISGYLFFLGGWSWEKYSSKLKRRIGTLLIPYLVWNLLTAAVFVAAESIPRTKAFTGGEFLQSSHSFSVVDFIVYVFGLSSADPIAYQFWFIRDLMALVLLSPGIYFLVKNLKSKLTLLIFAVLFSLWFLAIWPASWPEVASFFFFSMGSYFALHETDVNYLDRFGPWISAAFLGLLILHAASGGSIPYLQNILIVFGVPSLWWIVGVIGKAPKLKQWIIRLSAASFFVFAAHEPLLHILRNLFYKLLSPASGAAILALYFLIPIGLIVFLIAVHRTLLKIAPSFTSVITGSYARSNKVRA
ncbi:MAG: acyltransferase [Terracidiphilus sp.]|jgi:surface polysaccharide O-acyltransferase-like enzyme